MPLSRLDDALGLLHQSSGDRTAPPVVYLPGVHGDWTPQGQARLILSREFHFVETAYPRIHDWSIENFARALNDLLDHLGIKSAHVVAESFGSLVGWQFGIANSERLRSLTLVGGFSRAPRFGVAAAASAAVKLIPPLIMETAIDSYVAGKSAIGEKRETFETGAYPASRTKRGQQAVSNRMRIIQGADFRPHLESIGFPVRYIGGARDIIVPVRREIATLVATLPDHCEFESELVPRAPHALIASHPKHTAEWIASGVRKAEKAMAQTQLPTGVLDENI